MAAAARPRALPTAGRSPSAGARWYRARCSVRVESARRRPDLGGRPGAASARRSGRAHTTRQASRRRRCARRAPTRVPPATTHAAPVSRRQVKRVRASLWERDFEPPSQCVRAPQAQDRRRSLCRAGVAAKPVASTDQTQHRSLARVGRCGRRRLRLAPTLRAPHPFEITGDVDECIFERVLPQVPDVRCTGKHDARHA